MTSKEILNVVTEHNKEKEEKENKKKELKEKKQKDIDTFLLECKCRRPGGKCAATVQ